MKSVFNNLYLYLGTSWWSRKKLRSEQCEQLRSDVGISGREGNR